MSRITRSKYHRKRSISEINIVPYIDVMLVLLVIFMITAPLLSQGVRVDLPKARAKSLTAKQQTPIIVSVDKQGRYFLNSAEDPEMPLLPQQLLTRVAAELAINKDDGKENTVLVKGDKDVDYGRVVQVMVLLQQAGAEKVGLMTEDDAENK